MAEWIYAISLLVAVLVDYLIYRRLERRVRVLEQNVCLAADVTALSVRVHEQTFDRVAALESSR